MLRENSAPDRVERYESYRQGAVETRTFERGDDHLCYGVGDDGELYDFCFLGEEETLFTHGVLSPQEREIAQRFLDELLS